MIGVKVHDRHVVMAFATCIVCAVIWQRIVFDSSGTISFGQILSAPLGAGEALALFALFSLIGRMGNDTLLSRADLLLIAAAGAAFTLPSLKAGSIAMTPVAVLLITRRDARLASIGQLLLALAFYQLYGRLIFDLVAPYVLWLETGAVTGLLSFFGDFSQNGADIVAPSGHTIYHRAAVLRLSQYHRRDSHLAGADQNRETANRAVGLVDSGGHDRRDHSSEHDSDRADGAVCADAAILARWPRRRHCLNCHARLSTWHIPALARPAGRNSRMKPTGKTRVIALVALTAALLVGSWTRWESAQAERSQAAPSKDALLGLRLNDGATVDDFVSDPGDGVRLRLDSCDGAAFLFPLRIDWVSTAEGLDRSFASSDYRTIDIYRGQIRREWGRFDRIYDYVKANLAAIGSGATPAADRLYVRIYVGAHCQAADGVLVDWANTVLAHWV